MKLQSLTIIFIIIILPVTLVLSAYIGYELKTIDKQNLYNSGLISATHDAIFSFEINSKNDEFSNNPEMKRDIIKSAVKTFENSLSTTCNLGLYGNDKIEEFIPAVVFGLYDGFYMYAPYQTKDEGYKHELRNYVYYSETLLDTDIVIRYSLDNYVAVSGTIGGEYQTKAGYLINESAWPDLSTVAENLNYKKYNSQTKTIEQKTDSGNSDAQNYYKDAISFTSWFNTNIGNEIKDKNNNYYLKIDNNNDPENEAHEFTKHKRQIMKDKIQTILNSSITAYANKTKNNYKMPVMTEEEWQKIYTNISVVTFVQGMNLGLKKYNNYCVLNSTNSNEYVNPNLIYFTDSNENPEYHDIRCEKLKSTTSIVGYKIGDFEKTKVEVYKEGSTTETEEKYYYKHDETACYDCINGALETNTSIYDYVRDSSTNPEVKTAYFTALARERYKTTKLSDRLN